MTAAGSRIEFRCQLRPGRYEAAVYGCGPSGKKDSVFLTVNKGKKTRILFSNRATWRASETKVEFTAQAGKPVTLLLSSAEPGVLIDAVVLRPK
jgi:hypothetical protein